MLGRVLVFGTFDGLHPGHIFFLQQAQTFGTHLTVSVARDAHVVELKNDQPKHNEQERLSMVKKVESVDEVVLSDEILGTFDLISEVNPDLIVLGHDQDALEQAIKEWMKRSGAVIQIMRIIKQ